MKINRYVVGRRKDFNVVGKVVLSARKLSEICNERGELIDEEGEITVLE